MKVNVLILFISLSLASYGGFAMPEPNKIPSNIFFKKKGKPHQNFYGKGPVLIHRPLLNKKPVHNSKTKIIDERQDVIR